MIDVSPIRTTAEEHFAAIARHIPVLCWLCRHDRSQAHFSGAWAAYTGRQFTDGEWRECVHPDDRAAFDGLHCGADLGTVQYREVRIVSKTGEYRWHRVTCTPIADDGTRPEAHIFVAFDVQDERNAHAEVEKSRQRLALATEAAKVGVYEIDVTSDTVIWNERTARIFGVPLEQFDGRVEAMRAFLLPEDRARVTAQVRSVVRDGIPSASLEYRIRRSDGEIRHIRAFLLSGFDDKGDVATLHGAVVDWTSNYNDQKRLSDYKNRLQATYDGAGVGIKEIGADGVVERVNRAWETITGRSRDEVIGQIFWEEVQPAELQESTRDAFKRLVNGEIESDEVIIKGTHPKTGTPTWTLARTTAVRDDDGTFCYAIRVLNDVTEIQLLNEHQTLLLAELTHRVKNAMATVQSIATQTAPQGGNFRDAFMSRLHAISAVHDLNIKGSYFGASFGDILKVVLGQRQEGTSSRSTLSGPVVLINPSAAVNFGLALHELAYNAASHGGLSGEVGSIAISWEMVGSGEEQVLRLIWEESGGPEVSPPRSRGFGSRFVATFARHLHGSYAPDYRSGGLRIVLEVPTLTILANEHRTLMKL